MDCRKAVEAMMWDEEDKRGIYQDGDTNEKEWLKVEEIAIGKFNF